MSYPPVPEPGAIASHFIGAVTGSDRADWPFRHWKLREVFPEALCTAILVLPIAPPLLGRTDGTRGSYNRQRTFITPELRAKFPVCSALADALQRPAVAREMAETCDIDVAGSYLRMEYMQDLDGAWLEPHRDIPEKLFSMVIYLFTGPDAKDWGTDIYDADQRWVARSPGTFNTGVIFVPGLATWHGFDPRPIVGVRRLMEINYVRPGWRDREQLAMPDQPIRLG
jgi:hypothetical protein